MLCKLSLRLLKIFIATVRYGAGTVIRITFVRMFFFFFKNSADPAVRKALKLSGVARISRAAVNSTIPRKYCNCNAVLCSSRPPVPTPVVERNAASRLCTRTRDTRTRQFAADSVRGDRIPLHGDYRRTAAVPPRRPWIFHT